MSQSFELLKIRLDDLQEQIRGGKSRLETTRVFVASHPNTQAPSGYRRYSPSICGVCEQSGHDARLHTKVEVVSLEDLFADIETQLQAEMAECKEWWQERAFELLEDKGALTKENRELKESVKWHMERENALSEELRLYKGLIGALAVNAEGTSI